MWLEGFDAFFNNVMFHEIAHGLGIKHTLTGLGTVREALQDQSSALEEGKADILGLYMIMNLEERGEWEGGALNDHSVTFRASILQSIRFGAAISLGGGNRGPGWWSACSRSRWRGRGPRTACSKCRRCSA